MSGLDTTQQRQKLKEKVKELQATVNLLKKELQTLTKKNTNQKIVYNLNSVEENYFKLYNYFIKSISSIYIYILLGDEYQELYKKIENLLHVDPFQQHRNFNEFQKVIKNYPNITNKNTIYNIFLYKNQEIKYQIKTCIYFSNMRLFLKFLNSNSCKLLNFYENNNSEIDKNDDLENIFSIIYLDHFKDEKITDNYNDIREMFVNFLYHEFPKLFRFQFKDFPHILSDNILEISKERTRNYMYIIDNELFPRSVLNKINQKLEDPCK